MFILVLRLVSFTLPSLSSASASSSRAQSPHLLSRCAVLPPLFYISACLTLLWNRAALPPTGFDHLQWTREIKMREKDWSAETANTTLLLEGVQVNNRVTRCKAQPPPLRGMNRNLLTPFFPDLVKHADSTSPEPPYVQSLASDG